MKNNIVKIPKNINIFYNNTKNLLILKGPLDQKSVKLSIKIIILKSKIKVTSIPLIKISNNKIKTLKSIQKTTITKIKQLLIETKSITYKKLNIVGIGLRVLNVNNFNNKLLSFRLGYSHNIYYKIQKKINIFCLKSTKLFIFSNSFQEVSQTAAQIRMNKLPNPYKIKGILYSDESVTIKKGKKI